MRPVPYPVQASKLDTRFLSDPKCTHHVKFVSDHASNQRRIRKEEKWRWERGLARGSYGVVWLERCIQGDDKGSVRAVKEVQKPQSGEYYGELEAIALFSHAKYEHCFVKSLGWFDDEYNIFIAMEYLPNGDLQNYLHSPLSEKEARHIVLQVLEGLQFMHDNGFTHRDLKPANILVKCKGPDWWVKIADFGISKHVIEEQTALRTSVGTPSFAAPEVLGFFRPGDGPKDFYTNAVDVWSLGVIAFRILSAENPFKDAPRLNQYVMGNIEFPWNVLLLNKVGAQGCDFVNSLMALNPEDRPRVKDCLHHPWFGEISESQGQVDVSSLSSSLDYFEPEPSANWSTRDHISTHEPSANWSTRDQLSTGTPKVFSKLLGREESPIPGELSTSSNPMSGKTLGPSTSPEYADPKPFSDPSIQDHISTHEPHRIGMIVEGTRSRSKHRITASIPIYNKMRTPSTTSNEVIELSTSSSREIVALPTDESSFHIKWRFLRSLKSHSAQTFSVILSPGGKLIATGSNDETIRVWDPATGKDLHKLKMDVELYSALAFSPDGTRLASQSSLDETVKLWDLATRTIAITLEGQSEKIYRATFSPDGTLLATGSRNGTVKLWDLATRTTSHTLKNYSKGISAVVFSPDGNSLASGFSDGTVKLWDPVTGSLRHQLHMLVNRSSLTSLAFSPDGTLLAFGLNDGTVELWNLNTMIIHHTLKGHTVLIMAIAFSPDGTLLASGSSDRTVKLWDPFTGTMLQSLKSARISINAIAFSPDGNTIVIAEVDGRVAMWSRPGNEKTNSTSKENLASGFWKRLLK